MAVPQAYYDAADLLFDRSLNTGVREVGKGDTVGAQSAKSFVYNGVPYYLFRLTEFDEKSARLYAFGGEFKSTELPQDITFDLSTYGPGDTFDTGINVVIPIDFNYDELDSVYLAKADYHWTFVPKAGLTGEAGIAIVTKDYNGDQVGSLTLLTSFATSSTVTERFLLENQSVNQVLNLKRGYSLEYRIGGINNAQSITFKQGTYFRVQVNNENNEYVLPDNEVIQRYEMGYLFQGGRTTYPLAPSNYLTDPGTVSMKYAPDYRSTDYTTSSRNTAIQYTAFSTVGFEDIKFGLVNSIRTAGTVKSPEAFVFDARGGVRFFTHPFGIVKVHPNEPNAPIYLLLETSLFGAINPTVDNWYKLNGGPLQTAPEAYSLSFLANNWTLVRLTGDVSTAQTIEILGSTPI